MPTQAQARCKSLVRKQNFLNLVSKISCWEKYCQKEQKTWLNCMIVADKPEFNCSEYKIWKCPSFSVSICWKFAYNRSWKPNYLKGIQLSSCHSVACPTSHFAKGQTQRPLWLYTFKYSFFLMQYFKLEVVPGSSTLVTSSWQVVNWSESWQLLTRNWSHVTWLTQDYR